ncbi:MAG: GNAT family N-acetyltransferase [Gammaproteobacteria bacterium]
MSIRNLEFALKPRSVALIGASKQPGSVGAVLARNLFKGGFDGPIMPVNPKYQAIEGVLTYPSIEALPLVPDLAIISTPPETVPGIVEALGRKGTRAAVVITAGFGERGEGGGRALQQALLDAARPHLLRIIGPNCLGVLVPGIGLNASFAHLNPVQGPIAFVAQSGAIVTSVMDWAERRGIGFSHLVSLGDMADVDFGDLLDYLASDPETRAILLYIEAVTAARKFMSAARAAARMKPTIVVKAGRHAEGARACASHTGAMAGSDAVYEAVFRRAGMLRVYSLDELFDAVEILAMAPQAKGPRMAILSNGGGLAVLATDHLIDEGGVLAELAPQTMERLNAALPPTWSHHNPVDIIGDAPGGRYAQALSALIEDPGVDAVLALNCPTAVASGTEAAQALIEALGERRDPALITSWVGDGAAEAARRMFRAHRIPSYATPGQAVRAFMYLVNYRRSQELLMQTPPSVPEEFTPDTGAARVLIGQAMGEGRAWLTEPEAKALLAAYGVPAVATQIARTPAEAAVIAAEIGAPVALKILSRDITHKSDLGGVALGLLGAGAVEDAASAMHERIRAARPEARIEGFSVQPMVHRPGAYELIAGMIDDVQFGPVILFGQGGTAVEVIADQALGLPPLNMRLAAEIISRTRIHKQLRGFRGVEPVDLEALAMTLIRISQMVIEHPEIAELDVNPLLADARGVVALDARIKLAEPRGEGADRLAIRPYPKGFEEEVALAGGQRLLLRPIRPEDEPALQAIFAHLTPEQVRMRFFGPLKSLSHAMAARITQVDYDREMGLVLSTPGVPGRTEIYGVAQVSADPDNERAEYAILVRGDMTGRGIGTLLMQHMIAYCRGRGIGEIYGDVLSENLTMRRLCKKLGFAETPLADDPGIVRVTVKL